MLSFVAAWGKHTLHFLRGDQVTSAAEDTENLDDALAIAEEAEEALIPEIVHRLRSENIEPLDVPDITPSELGYLFQQTDLCLLMQRVANWNSVRFYSLRGDEIESACNMKRGRDGGIDVIIVITTATERGTKIVTGRIINILKTQDYKSAVCSANRKGCKNA